LCDYQELEGDDALQQNIYKIQHTRIQGINVIVSTITYGRKCSVSIICWHNVPL